MVLAWTNPVADDAGAEHIGDEFIFLAIPGKQNGTRAAAAVKFADGLRFFGSEIYFVLWDTRRPEEANDFCIFFFAKASENVGSVLSEIPRRALHFPLLIE